MPARGNAAYQRASEQENEMNFDDYKNNVPYPDRVAYKAGLIDYINSQRLTGQEREDLLAAVPARVRDWFKEAVKPYNEEEHRLEAKFWADCREDIGYDEFLDAEGILTLQCYAWEQGHSGGYHEVYNCLLDLSDFAEKLIKSGRKD
jgi:hypothetical protein